MGPITNKPTTSRPSFANNTSSPRNEATLHPPFQPITECGNDENAVLKISFIYELENDLTSKDEIETSLKKAAGVFIEEVMDDKTDCGVSDYLLFVKIDYNLNNANINASICFNCTDEQKLNVNIAKTELEYDFIETVKEETTILTVKTIIEIEVDTVNEKKVIESTFATNTDEIESTSVSNTEEFASLWLCILGGICIFTCILAIIYKKLQRKQVSDTLDTANVNNNKLKANIGEENKEEIELTELNDDARDNKGDIEDIFGPGPDTKQDDDDEEEDEEDIEDMFGVVADIKMNGDIRNTQNETVEGDPMIFRNIDKNIELEKAGNDGKEVIMSPGSDLTQNNDDNDDRKTDGNGMNEGNENDDFDEVRIWLRDVVGLEQFYGKFKVNGIHSFGMIKNIDHEQLFEFGVEPIANRHRIMYYVKVLNKQYQEPMNDDDDDNENESSYHSVDSDRAYNRFAIVKQTSFRGLTENDKTPKQDENDENNNKH